LGGIFSSISTFDVPAGVWRVEVNGGRLTTFDIRLDRKQHVLSPTRASRFIFSQLRHTDEKQGGPFFLLYPDWVGHRRSKRR
jgi:hypothetical protein